MIIHTKIQAADPSHPQNSQMVGVVPRFVHPSIRPSVRPSVRPSLHVYLSVCPKRGTESPSDFNDVQVVEGNTVTTNSSSPLGLLPSLNNYPKTHQPVSMCVWPVVAFLIRSRARGPGLLREAGHRGNEEASNRDRHDKSYDGFWSPS